MPFVNPPLPNQGESADAGDISAPFLALLAVFNGNIGADNLAPGTIPAAIGDGDIGTAKLAALAVTAAKIALGSITPDKVAPLITLTPAANVFTPLLNSRINALPFVATSTITVPSGTPQDGQALTLRIRDNGVQHGITWNAIFRPIGLTLPSVTFNPGVYVNCSYNAIDTKWDVLSVARIG